MDWRTIDGFAGQMDRLLERFDDCFARSEGRDHLKCYVNGQLSQLPRKNVEAMADQAGVPPRTLQDFLSTHTWDHQRAIDCLQQIVAQEHHDEHAIGLIDETSFAKRGDHTACVQRQYCGHTGKIDNCVVSVHLGYATFDGRLSCLLDGQLTLPQSWEQSPNRRERVGVPASMTHQPKWQIALDLLRRAMSNGVRFKWLTFDEGYGGCVKMLEQLGAMGQNYVAEVPCSFHGWLTDPTVLQKHHHPRNPGKTRKSAGRPCLYPRLSAKSLFRGPACRVDRLCRHSPMMRNEPWQTFHIKDTHKGPLLWQVKATRFRYSIRQEDSHRHLTLPSTPCWLIYAQNVHTQEIKYFVSNAPSGTPTETLLHVAFSRWHVERLLEDDKGQLGLADFECRRWQAITRHFVLSAISHLLLSRLRLQLESAGEKKDIVTAAASCRRNIPGLSKPATFKASAAV